MLKHTCRETQKLNQKNTQTLPNKQMNSAIEASKNLLKQRRRRKQKKKAEALDTETRWIHESYSATENLRRKKKNERKEAKRV